MRAILCVLVLLISAPAFAEKWALLIGINDYEDRNYIASLGAADNDARKLKEVLKSKMGFPDANIDLLVSDGDNKPTRANIIDALGRLSGNAKPGDTVFVFYSGHGTEINGVTYLLPHDFKGRNKFTGTETALAIARFKELLGEVKAKALIMAWDMCRNDPFAKGKSGDAARAKLGNPKAWQIVPDKTRSIDSPITVTLFACSPGQSSFEWQDKNRGYFAWFLEEGMRGQAADRNGNITVGSLAKYVNEQVRAQTRATEPAEQTPISEMLGVSPYEFVLLSTGKPVTGSTTTPKPSSGNVKTISTRSTLLFTGAPKGAEIRVGNSPVRAASWAIDLLEPSQDFLVTIIASGYRPKQLNVTLERGKTLHVDASLEKEEATDPDTNSGPGTGTKAPPPQSKVTGALGAILTKIRQTHRADSIAALSKPLKFYGQGTAKLLSDSGSLDNYFAVLDAVNNYFRTEYVDQGAKKKMVIGFSGDDRTAWKTENGKSVTTGPNERFFANPVGALFYVLLGNEFTVSEKFSKPANAQPYLSATDKYLGDFKILYDSKTFLITEISFKSGGLRPVFKYQNWKQIEGIPMPHVMIEDIPGGNITFTYSRIEPNAPYGAEYFARPR